MEAQPAAPGADHAARALTDVEAFVLAAAVALGAWWARPVPVPFAALGVVVALVRRRPAALVLAALLLAAGLGFRAEEGLRPPGPERHEGVVTLVADPRETPWGTRVDVRVGSRRFELQASGGAAGTVGRALAGERLWVVGRLRPPSSDAPWFKPRHVVGQLAATHAEPHDAGAAPWRAANRLRRLLERGADVMAEPARSLYSGFVLGDDRGQSVEVVDDFRAAGLTHLLVVSGSNVAYLLALATPVTGRMPLWGRGAVTLGIIASFAVVTRFEPSILRASAMAALAVTTTLAGRPTGSLRTISLAVAGLVLVDPLLVHSIAFQLSVAASLGIVLLSRPIARAIPGPRWLGDALGVTLAAQLAVAPVLVPRFGGMPVVAIPANVLTVPAAGLVTTWGLPAGVVAGAVGSEAGRWLHLPTAACIEWVASTARIAAGLPFGELQTPGLVVAAVAGAAAVWGRSRGWPAVVTTTCVGVVLAALLAPAFGLRSPPLRTEPAAGVAVYRSGGATVVVVDGSPSVRTVLESLRRDGVRRLDVVVTGSAEPALERALRHRWPVGRLIATDDGASSVVVGDLWVRVGGPDAGTAGPGERAGEEGGGAPTARLVTVRPVARDGAGQRAGSDRTAGTVAGRAPVGSSP